MRPLALAVVTAALVLVQVRPSSADVLVFVSGRTMSIAGSQRAGDSVTVTLRNGGTATFPASMISHVEKSAAPAAAPVAAVPAPMPAHAPGAAPETRPYAELIRAVAAEHGIDPALIHAVVETESNYQAHARSPVGARGLMQVMPSTARDLGVASVRRLDDPRENLQAGVRYLSLLLHQFNGDLTSALAAYNAGPAAVRKYAGVPPFPETEDYVRRVLSKFQP